MFHSRLLSIMYGAYSICNADSDTYVSARRGHLLRHDVPRSVADGYNDGSGISSASNLVSLRALALSLEQ